MVNELYYLDFYDRNSDFLFTLDILPLIEFELKEDFSEDDAVELIKSGQNIYQPCKKQKALNDWKEEHNQEFETLKLIDNDKQTNPDEANNVFVDDPFSEKMSNFQNDDLGFQPILVDRANLAKINPSDLIISEWPKPLKKCFHRNLISDIPISKCPFCHKVNMTHNDYLVCFVFPTHLRLINFLLLLLQVFSHRRV